MYKEKKRLDVFLFEQGVFDSREKARKAVIEGNVKVDSLVETKPGRGMTGAEEIEILSKMEFVSRGGYKLKKALKVFDINLGNLVCIDIGASTGGFTDCMLQNGANKVYAVDVGHSQLAGSLQSDNRVISIEGVNFRYFEKESLGDEIDFAAVDVSFISLEKILGIVYNVLKAESACVCLIKPQFEAGRENIGKNGIVRDKKVHIDILKRIIRHSNDVGFRVRALDFSPIPGGDGNIEYLIYLLKSDKVLPENYIVDAVKTVEEAHV